MDKSVLLKEDNVGFIICPVGDDDSQIRIHSRTLIDTTIRPVLEEMGYNPLPNYEISSHGSIANQIIKYLLDSKIVIAILTYNNPNVMYELAVRHSARKPVICIAEEGTKLPFDIQTDRIIVYENRPNGWDLLRQRLKSSIEYAKKEKESDNPIYRVVDDTLIKNELKSTGAIQEFILKRIEEINYRLSSISLERDQKQVSDDVNLNDRPNELNSRVVNVDTRNGKLLIIITFINDKPFELFCGYSEEFFNLPPWVEEGTVILNRNSEGKSRLDFRFEDSDGYSVTIQGFISRFFKRIILE